MNTLSQMVAYKGKDPKCPYFRLLGLEFRVSGFTRIAGVIMLCSALNGIGYRGTCRFEYNPEPQTLTRKPDPPAVSSAHDVRGGGLKKTNNDQKETKKDHTTKSWLS